MRLGPFEIKKRGVEPDLNVGKDYVQQQIAEKLSDISGDTLAGENISESSAMKFSAFWACVRLLSELPASLQKQVIRVGKDGSLIEDRSHYLYKLIEEPNSLMDSFTCDEVMNQSLQIHGNAVAPIFYDNKGYPVEKIPVPWKCVDVRMSNRKLYYIINDPVMDIRGTFPASDVLHYKILSPDGLIGRSVLQHARENIGLGKAAERFGSQYFQKGGILSGVIESTGEFQSDGAYRSWLKSFNERFKGVKNNFDVPLLERGMQYKQLTIPLEQAQFLETRKFQLSDICRWFNLPPQLISELSKASYSSLEQQDLQFVKYTLRSLVKKQEKEIEWKIIPSKERGSVYVRYNLDSLLRGDMATRSAFYHNMVCDGIFTRNEVRIMENRNPIEGLDEVLVPANIVGKQAEITNNSNK